MKRFLFALLIIGTFSIAPRAAGAIGALAIGEPQNLADGFASGWATGVQDEKTARERAFRQCRDKADAPEQVRALCKVIQVFTNQCVSIALDVEAGETGTGYAVAPTKAEAERVAMENCRKTAGKRADECRIITGGCDGNAK